MESHNIERLTVDVTYQNLDCSTARSMLLYIEKEDLYPYLLKISALLTPKKENQHEQSVHFIIPGNKIMVWSHKNHDIALIKNLEDIIQKNFGEKPSGGLDLNSDYNSLAWLPEPMPIEKIIDSMMQIAKTYPARKKTFWFSFENLPANILTDNLVPKFGAENIYQGKARRICGVQEKHEQSKKMSKWKILAGLGAAYIAFLFYGVNLHNQRLEQYEKRVFSKADKNSNGFIEVEEALDVYRTVGVSNAEVLKGRVSEYNLLNFIGNAAMSEMQKEIHQDIVMKEFNYWTRRTLGRYMDSKEKEKLLSSLSNRIHNKRVKSLLDLAFDVADTDNNQVLSDEELEHAFRLAYRTKMHNGNERVDRLRLHPWSQDSHLDMGKFLLFSMTYPPATIDGSEGDRYVNAKEE